MRARIARQLRFYGWRIALFGAIGIALTAPGQTVGVSVFVDELIVGLDLTRSQVSLAYLVGTLCGAAALPFFGRAIDRFGVRVMMTGIGVAFGAALVGISQVVGFATLIVGFAGIRMLGQGALSLVSSTSVALWFERRRGLALGLTVAAGATLMSLAPLGLTALVARLGWRLSWVVVGLVVGTAVVAIALLGMRNRPEDVGQRIDGDLPDPDRDERRRTSRPSWTRTEAMRTPMFWLVVGSVFTVGMISTSLQFHQFSLLGEQGLTTTQAAANFVPQTGAVILATIGVGALTDRLDPRWLFAATMTLLAAAMLLVPFVAPGLLAAGYAVCLGLATGSTRSLEAATLPRFFGVGNIGAIRGVVIACSSAGTAFGPLALATGFEVTGSYAEVLRVLVVVPAGIALFALFVRPPTPEHLETIRARPITAPPR